MTTTWNIVYFVVGFYAGHVLGVTIGNLVKSIVSEFKKDK